MNCHVYPKSCPRQTPPPVVSEGATGEGDPDHPVLAFWSLQGREPETGKLLVITETLAHCLLKNV